MDRQELVASDDIPAIDARIRKAVKRIFGHRPYTERVMDQDDLAQMTWVDLLESGGKAGIEEVKRIITCGDGPHDEDIPNAIKYSIYRIADGFAHSAGRNDQRRLELLRQHAKQMTEDTDPGIDEQLDMATKRLERLRKMGGIDASRVLRYVEDDKTRQEIADQDGVTVAAVYRSFFRIKQILG